MGVSLLLHGRPAIGVEQLKLVKSVDLECKGSLFIHTLLGKVLEDLLQGSLGDSIFLNVQGLFL